MSFLPKTAVAAPEETSTDTDLQIDLQMDQKAEESAREMAFSASLPLPDLSTSNEPIFSTSMMVEQQSERSAVIDLCCSDQTIKVNRPKKSFRIILQGWYGCAIACLESQLSRYPKR